MIGARAAFLVPAIAFIGCVTTGTASSPSSPSSSGAGPSAAAAPTPGGILHRNKAALNGTTQTIDFFYSVNPDCSTRGIPAVRVTRAPQKGRVVIDTSDGYSDFPMGNRLSACNTQRRQGTSLTYLPNPGVTGSDSIAVEVISPGGFYWTVEYSIAVR